MKKISVLFTIILVIVFSFGVSASSMIRDIIGKENRGIIVTFNNEAQVLKDGNLNIVYPVIINGSTYLPVRSIAQMFNSTITWNSATQTVSISPQQENGTSSVPTDLGDSAGQSSNTTTAAIELKLGLSQNDIFSLYGNPEFIDSNNQYKWEYSRFVSYIEFDKDWKVIGWNSAPKIDYKNNQSSKINLGMTKNEITKAYGIPIFIDSNNQYRWEYSRFVSYIDFDKDWKVIGWSKMNKGFEK